jgi:hypothetical protein
MIPESTLDHVKVRFDLDESDWHGRPNETLWAKPVESPNQDVYQLMNSPLFAKGISFLDLVRTRPTNEDLIFEFVEVTNHSGHSTYMLLVPPDQGEFERCWHELEQHGCSYESKSLTVSLGSRVLYSVDVPPNSDITAVYSILDKGESEGVWMFQEGHMGHHSNATT